MIREPVTFMAWDDDYVSYAEELQNRVGHVRFTPPRRARYGQYGFKHWYMAKYDEQSKQVISLTCCEDCPILEVGSDAPEA